MMSHISQLPVCATQLFCANVAIVPKVFSCAIFVLVYLLIPGACEVTENLIHYVTEGHSAHALDDEEHQSTGDEHGCSGSFHLCQCHSSVAFLLGAAECNIGVPTCQEHATWRADDTPSDGVLDSVFRPPIV